MGSWADQQYMNDKISKDVDSTFIYKEKNKNI